MADTAFTFRVDDQLKSAFAETAKARDRTAARLLRALMRDAVARRREALDHDAWFRGEVERAVGEADDPQVLRIPHERVLSSWRQQRALLVERTRRETT